MVRQLRVYGYVFCLLAVFMGGGCKKNKTSAQSNAILLQTSVVNGEPKTHFFYVVNHDVPMRWYLDFMDSLTKNINLLLPYTVSEHLIVRANPWLIDSLENTDYYRLKEKGIFSYDQKAMTILRQGDSLAIPDSMMVDSLKKKMAATRIDVNIPEYKMRIFEGDTLLYTFPIRVGQNKVKFLAMSGKMTDLRTKTGKGKIVDVDRNPVLINPVDNKRYTKTFRDDSVYSLLPRIPWLETQINGERYGQMIHPTTNPVTLGKAYSNGCLGLKEADAWRVYYYAPIGTAVTIRYQLQIIDEKGDTIQLKDIYRNKNKSSKAAILAFDFPFLQKDKISRCLCDDYQ